MGRRPLGPPRIILLLDANAPCIGCGPRPSKPRPVVVGVMIRANRPQRKHLAAQVAAWRDHAAASYRGGVEPTGDHMSLSRLMMGANER